MIPLTTAAESARSITVTQDVPWGTIAICLAVVFVACLYAVLALKGRAPGIKAKMGDKEVELGDHDEGPGVYVGPDRRSCPDIDARALMLPQLVSRRRMDSINAAWAKQKALADDMEDDFWPMLDRRGVDGWQIETSWSRLHRVLYNAADQNHILDVVKEGQVDVDYLEDKVAAFRRRYDKLLARAECNLPKFQTIAEEVRALLAAGLVRFAAIAQEEEDQLQAFADGLKRTVDHPDILRAIDEAAQRGLPEVA
jgi:hypothetical protein